MVHRCEEGQRHTLLAFLTSRLSGDGSARHRARRAVIRWYATVHRALV